MRRDIQLTSLGYVRGLFPTPGEYLAGPMGAPQEPSPRSAHTIVATGPEFHRLGWKCRGRAERPGLGVLISRPAPGAPLSNVNAADRAAANHSAVWDGAAKMIVWGGSGAGRCDAKYGGQSMTKPTQSWRAMTLTSAPTDRNQHTPRSWAGRSDARLGRRESGRYFSNDGGSYVSTGGPAAQTNLNGVWTAIPPSAVIAARARGIRRVWTGSRMLVWGGLDANRPRPLGNGASYNPSTGTLDAAQRERRRLRRVFGHTRDLDGDEK